MNILPGNIELQSKQVDVLHAICKTYNASYIYIILLASYKHDCPIYFYNTTLNQSFKYKMRLNSDSSYTELNESSIIKISNEEKNFIIGLVNTPVDASLKIIRTGARNTDNSDLPKHEPDKPDNNLFHTVTNWKTNSVEYTAVEISDKLNGVICLGYADQNNQQAAHSITEQLDFTFNIANAILKAFEDDLKDLHIKHTITNDNLFNKNDFLENKPNYLQQFAKETTEILEAQRTHVFIIKEKLTDLSIEDREHFVKYMQLKHTEANLPDYEHWNGELLQLAGCNEEIDNSISSFLIDKEGFGKTTWNQIRKARTLIDSKDNKYILSEENLIYTVNKIQNSGFANFKLALTKGFKSILSVILYDESTYKIVGIMNVFFAWEKPLFNYHRSELISLIKNGLRQYQVGIKTREASQLQRDLKELEWKNLDVLKDEDIEKHLQTLSRLSGIYKLGYIKHSELKTPIEEYESGLLFKRNCKPYFLQNLQVNDIKFFGDIYWNFDKNMNIILGNNGYGKSYLLRTIVALLQQKSEHINTFFKPYDNEISTIELRLRHLRENLTPIRDEESIKEKTTIRFNEAGFEPGNDGLSMGVFPVLAIPSIRSVRQSKSVSGLFGHLNGDLKRIGAISFLNEEPFENFIEEFLNDLCVTYLERSRSGNPGDSFEDPKFEIIKLVMHDLNGDITFKYHSIERVVNGSGFRFLVQTNEATGEPLPIQQVSQGTMSVIAIFGLIYRYLIALDPGKKELEQIKKSQGVVIIDEVDAHLHPAWQQKIISLLQKYFPCVQFFVSSHSPLVIAGCKEGQVSVLRKGENKNYDLQNIPYDFIGLRSAELYEYVFGIQDIDHEFLKYNAKVPFLPEMETRLNQLVRQDGSDMDQIDKLSKEIRIVKKIKEVQNTSD